MCISLRQHRTIPALRLKHRSGKILWVKEPEFEVDQKAIPRVITDVQENGTALQVDNQRKRYVKTEEFDEDKPNGYGRFKVFLLRRKLKKH